MKTKTYRYTVRDVSTRWRCRPEHVRSLIARGKLKALRIGARALRISAEDLESFEEKNFTGAA